MTTTKTTTAMAPTAWDKRLAETKGFVEYNPAESFVIHVQWVVANQQCARDMLQALNKGCAQATLRDAPPVLCYCFRISHDQRLAMELKNKVQTAGDHPQLAKKFKMADMNMPLSVIAATCDREGICSVPFRQGEGGEEDGGCWSKDTVMTPERAKLLGFDPVVLDCTEIYLDNRAFSNHAMSKDYLNAYSILMQPFRSLEVHTVVAGTPTIGIWNRVLEPMLKARRAQEPEPERLKLQPRVWSDFAAMTSLSSSSSSQYLLLDVNVTKVKVAEDLISGVPNSPYHCLFQLPESSSSTVGGGGGYRLIMPVAVADADTLREVLVGQEVVMEDGGSSSAAGVCGRIMLFSKESTESSNVNNQQTKTMLQEMFGSHDRIEIVLVADTSSPSSSQRDFAGYGLTEKLAELVQDTTVECKDYDKE